MNTSLQKSHTAYRTVKTIADAFCAAALLIILLPLILCVALSVRLTMGQPVIFRQQRAGLHGKLFNIYKFRTMTDSRNPDGTLCPDAERLSPLGRAIRAASLDELPQLLNVLKGEMSLVGPRPLLPEYLDRYSPRQARRHEVKPGITGWAQANGRNALSWEDRFELDVYYVENQSLRLDLQILALTFKKVFHRDGISQPGQATMQPFMGSTPKQEGS